MPVMYALYEPIGTSIRHVVGTLENALVLPTAGGVDGSNLIYMKFLQPLKADVCIVATFEGIVIFFNE